MWLLLFISLFLTAETWDYCIIGAGPGGIQLAYYLQKSGLDYVIVERNSIPGSFFEVYPRRRTLISINKRNTGETNTEFNMRHDWNSLLSDDPEMVFKHYSKEMFPPADTLLKYLDDYVTKFQIKIHFNTNVDQIVQDQTDSSFSLFTSTSGVYNCKYVVASTGISVLHKLQKHTAPDEVEGYDTASHDPADYEGKKVLILGKGNSAFETADLIYGNTDYVHLLSRDRVKLSWNTHYVGDVRGVNNQLLDTYQLKSLDAIIERDLDSKSILFEKKGDKIFLRDTTKTERMNSNALGPYDKIINCLGFDYDPEPFKNLTNMRKGEEWQGKRRKYPEMGWDFQSNTVKNLYYAGTITHGLDKRISSGGFIHGFRYSSRSLAWILAARNHGIRWPSEKVPLYGVVPYMLKRFNEMNGPYQMFYVLVDVYLRLENTVEVFKDVPHGLLHRFHELLAEPRGSRSHDLVVVRLEYGAGYSQIGGDPFKLDRAELDPYRAHTCNFIHPVLYHFTKLPHAVPIRSKGLKGASNKIHLSEDLYTDFATLTRHWTPLSNFIGTIWKEDMSFVSPEDCLHKHLTRDRQSEQCRNPTVIVSSKTVNLKTIRKAPQLTNEKLLLLDILGK